MTKSDVKVPYQLLIRYDDLGRPRGAHVEHRRVVTLDGEVLKDEPLPAEPLSLDNFPSSDIIGSVARDAILRAQDLEAAVAEAHEKATVEFDRRRVAEGTIADLESKIEIMNENTKEKTAQFEAAQKNLALARAQVEELSKQIAKATAGQASQASSKARKTQDS